MRSATALTVVVVVAVLLPFGSAVGEETVAEASSVPGALGTTTTWIAALVPLARPPRLQTTTFAPLHEPWAGVADVSAAPAGSGMFTTMPSASSGPLFWTVTVYVSGWPAATGSG